MEDSSSLLSHLVFFYVRRRHDGSQMRDRSVFNLYTYMFQQDGQPRGFVKSQTPLENLLNHCFT